jgi:hypothetical protein
MLTLVMEQVDIYIYSLNGDGTDFKKIFLYGCDVHTFFFLHACQMFYYLVYKHLDL